MLMPIVSMNKMAMNESVATTCCYREVATPTAVYWEVLNGGWIGSGYVESLSWKKEPNAMWKSYPKDVYDADGNLGPITSTTSYPYQAYNTLLEKQDWFMAGTNETMKVWLSDGGWKTSDCDHSDQRCKYRSWDISYANNQHFDAKTKHTTGGDGWAKAHTAKQFSS